MSRKILPTELIEIIAQQQGITKKKSEAFMRAFFEVIEEGLRTDSFVKIKGFGTFKLVSVSERESVNINTGERFQISGHTKVSFLPDTAFKDLINRPFSHFETILIPDATTQEEIDAISDIPIEEQTEETGLPLEEDATSGNLKNEVMLPNEVIPTNNAEEVISEDDLVAMIADEAQTNGNAVESDAMTESTTTDAVTRTAQEEVPTPAITPCPSQETFEKIQEDSTKTDSQENIPETITVEQPSIQSNILQDENSKDVDTAEETTTEEASNSISNESTEDDMNTTNSPCARNKWRSLLMIILWGATIIISYLAGYHRIIPLDSNFHDKEVSQTVEDTISTITEATIDSISADSAQITLQPTTLLPTGLDTLSVIRGLDKATYEKLAEGQPQVEIGSFLIIGTFSKHTMRSGDTLFKLARSVYGHKDYVKYIIRYNQFPDPNNVHIGTEILLPQLVEKEECAG